MRIRTPKSLERREEPVRGEDGEAKAQRWVVEQAILPQIVLAGHTAHIQHVRDFTWRSPADVTPGYYNGTYGRDQVTRVWCVLVPFMRRWRGLAHSFLSFEFTDGRYLSISVEPRRDVARPYSLWKDPLRQFEIMYVIGEERDLIGMRVALWNSPVYLYPLRTTQAYAQHVFWSMLQSAQAHAQQPAFFNTFTNNCITNIRDAVNSIAPGHSPPGARLLLAGYLDELAYRRGLIDTDLSLAAARRRFDVYERARAAVGRADFSARIRA